MVTVRTERALDDEKLAHELDVYGVLRVRGGSASNVR